MTPQIKTFWLVFALLAVVLRGLVPVGYMPDFGARAGVIAIKICTGTGHETINIAADGNDKSVPKHAASVCDYAVNHVFGPWIAAITSILAVLFLAHTQYFLREFGFSPRRYFGSSPARAPPVFS